MENNIEERPDYESIEEADKHKQLSGYPELYQAVQKFDASYFDMFREQDSTDDFGWRTVILEADRVLGTIAKLVHSKLSLEEVAIFTFLCELIRDELSFQEGPVFAIPLFEGIQKLLKQSIEDKNMLAACVHLIEHIREYTLGQ